jgi:DNA polymerase I-like protein with 3'-5' exonuclease and polymerase domains
MPLVNGDAKQLEWRTAMYLSQDPVGISEIEADTDIHSDNQTRFRLPSRLIAKTYLFRLIYGGSAWSYAHDWNFRDVDGGTEEFWQNVINETYEKYQGLGAWHEWLMEEVERTNGVLTMPTGRQYLYSKRRTETKRGPQTSWPRTTILNYPVQGLGADIMALARVSLMKRMKASNSRSLLISTVHDSILVDCPPDEVKLVGKLMFEVFDDIPKNFDRLFKPAQPWNIPMQVEVQSGHTWGDMQDLTREDCNHAYPSH